MTYLSLLNSFIYGREISKCSQQMFKSSSTVPSFPFEGNEALRFYSFVCSSFSFVQINSVCHESIVLVNGYQESYISTEG